MKNYALLLVTMFLAAIGYGNDLTNQLETLKKEIGNVKGEKNSFEQILNYDPATPFKMSVISRETDRKGRITEKKYIVNLGLLDKNLVRRENKKDLMWVSIRSGGFPVIKVYEDGVISDYEEELILYSRNVDNARAIEEAVKAAIPLAEESWKNSISLPTSLSALKSWFKDEIKNIDAGDSQFKQALVPDEKHPARVWLNLEEFGKKGLKSSYRYAWNLGDLHEPSVKFNVKKNVVLVEADVRQDQDFVSVTKDGEPAGFSKSITFYAADVDQAQVFIQALRKAIPLARQTSEEILPEPSSLTQNIKLIQQHLKSFTTDGQDYAQSLSGEQVATYTYSMSSEKKTLEEVFIFNYSDLDPNAISIEPKKQLFELKIPTLAKQEFVEAHKDGEQQKYGKEVILYAPDLATAKQLQHLFRSAINLSPKEVTPKDFAWLQQTLTGFDDRKLEATQEIVMKEGETCKGTFNVRQESSKKVDEHLYEFNLYDLDPQNMRLNVRSKTVSVVLPTNYGEAIIKDYENGGKINYIKDISIRVPDIDTGRKILATVQKLATDCKD